MPDGKPGKFSTVEMNEIRYSVTREIMVGVRTVGCCCELTTSSKAVRHETLEEDRFQVGTRQVNGSGVTSRTGTDDNL